MLNAYKRLTATAGEWSERCGLDCPKKERETEASLSFFILPVWVPAF